MEKELEKRQSSILAWKMWTLNFTHIGRELKLWRGMITIPVGTTPDGDTMQLIVAKK